ncbi:thioredoxin-like protein [Tribonema minus]|uniref:Thioredoxin-like protein n=1 Tax=Tribonema minus TaxID=303371 RepID=A0A836CIU5_9STRA|nr:thioredoxin-like protein [Tribonema minus]
MASSIGALRVGDRAPCCTLPASDFKNVSVPVAGRKTVLAFFPAAFSGGPEKGCECQMATLNKELQELTAAGAAVVGISRELPFTMAAWAQKLGLQFPLLSDSNLKVAQQYVGTVDLGAMIDARTRTRGLAGYLSSNRGVVVVDERGMVIYKYVSTDTQGAPDPGVLPDLGPVKEAVLGARAKL